MKFRKKPVVVAATKYIGQHVRTVADELGIGAADGLDVCVSSCKLYDGSPILQIHTLEGIMTARAGDWIIRGVDGELYPCKAAIFEKTYEAVDEPALREKAERESPLLVCRTEAPPEAGNEPDDHATYTYE